MKQKLFLLLIAWFIANELIASSCCTNSFQPVAPYLSIRSQGANAPRRLVGTLPYTHLPGDCAPTGYFSVTPEVTGTFNHKQINKILFGTECDENVIAISGSQVAERGPNDWLAEYFYLPPDYQSTLSFKPWINNIIVDIDLYVSLDEWWHNTYIALYAPFVHTRWDLDMQECIQNSGFQEYPSTYFSPNAIQRNQLNGNFTQYVNGNRLPAIVQPTSTATNSDITIALQPLQRAQMSCRRKIHTGLAEIRLITGWDFWMCEDSHMGIAIHLGAPTGNRPKGEFLFEPIIGNGHHWEFGGGFNGHWTFWGTPDDCTNATFYFDSIVTHYFIATQKRTFDLKNKPFSRYMLATRTMDPVFTNTFTTGSLNYQGFTTSRPGPNGQFKDEFIPVANITTITVDVGVDVQAELTAFFELVHSCWTWDIGYNFWVRTCDDISLKPNKNPPLPQSFALKGDAFVFGFVQGSPINLAVQLSASESKATIHSGTNLSPTGNSSFDAGATNPNIDNPIPAVTPNPPGLPIPLVNGVNGLQINTSVDPIYISIPQDLDACASRTSGMSSKLFTHFQYNANPDKHCAWLPFFGVGGEVEWAHSSGCLGTNVSQWGIWVKGGISFE